MRTLLANAFTRLSRWLHFKSAPSGLTGSQWTGTSFVDAYKRNRFWTNSTNDPVSQAEPSCSRKMNPVLHQDQPATGKDMSPINP
jgi:hypothetical protein